jgi:DNA-binding winged helix-turn-helix (wHTH) protein
VPRYRFADFVLSPGQRLLFRAGCELPLIPRYFDLLVYLVERRHEAVHRRDIFDRVWSDVIVSDSALSQAVRTLRRTLGDDHRDPQFIRTVARHGYQFVFADVREEADDGTSPGTRTPGAPSREPEAVDPFEPLIERLCTFAATTANEEDQRDAAERLHALGTTEALVRLGARRGCGRARALLRDTRWSVAGAGPVPLLGAPSGFSAAIALGGLRFRRAARVLTPRWLAACAGGGTAGVVAGVLGGLALAAAPGSAAPLVVAPVLGSIGLVCGALGGAGVGAGLAAAEVLTRSYRGWALVAGGAMGGMSVGWATSWLAHWSLATLVGLRVPLSGGVAGVVLGGAAGLGYAFATRRATDGLAAPAGTRRLAVSATTACPVALAAFALAAAGWPLVGGAVHAIAQAAAGSQVALTPLARLIGEPEFGPLTGALLGTAEGGLFGFGLAFGLTRRPLAPPPGDSSRTSHASLTDR